MTTAQLTLDRLTRHNSLIAMLIGIALLTAACGAAPQPITPTAPLVTSEPTSGPTEVLPQPRTPQPYCIGWWCTLSGTVYSRTATDGHELAEATVHFDQYSNCSPTSGLYTLTTNATGQFSIEVYIHDTDGFRFFADYAGEKSAGEKYGGMDCLSCSCRLEKLVIAPATTLPELAAAVTARQLLKEVGDRTWWRWSEMLPPLLLRDGEYDYLLEHPDPPSDFIFQPAESVAGQPVYRRAGHLVPVPAATAWKVGDVWSVAAPTREEFQQAIDAQLGKGVVQLDTVSYMRAIVHEAFHAYAMTIVQGQVPDFGADVDEKEMIQLLAALPELDKQHAAEGQALVKALQATDDQSARKAAAEFLKLRRTRRAVGDKHIAAYEQMTEWLEGLARYSEVEVMRQAGYETDRLSTASVPYPAAEEVWQQFLEQLSNPAVSPDGFRGRYYLLGAGQAFLLDRLWPDWQARALRDKQSLENLLEQAAQ
jgi:hypothetical protein